MGYLSVNSPSEMIPKQFDLMFNKYRVGFVMSICGSPWLKMGTGKSVTAVKIGEVVDPDFSIDKVCMTPREFLNCLDNIEESGKPGQIAVMDEGNISAPSALWYSFTNKAITTTLATFRNLRCAAIVVTPSLSWVDKRIRTLASYWGFSTVSYDSHNKTRRYDLRLYKVTTDLPGEKIYFRKLQFYDNVAKRIIVAKSFRVRAPSKELLAAYEKKATEFKKGVRQDFIKEIERFEAIQDSGGQRKPKYDLHGIARDLWDNEAVKREFAEKGRISKSLVLYVRPEVSNTAAQTIAKIANIAFRGKK